MYEILNVYETLEKDHQLNYIGTPSLSISLSLHASRILLLIGKLNYGSFKI